MTSNQKTFSHVQTTCTKVSFYSKKIEEDLVAFKYVKTTIDSNLIEEKEENCGIISEQSFDEYESSQTLPLDATQHNFFFKSDRLLELIREIGISSEVMALYHALRDGDAKACNVYMQIKESTELSHLLLKQVAYFDAITPDNIINIIQLDEDPEYCFYVVENKLCNVALSFLALGIFCYTDEMFNAVVSQLNKSNRIEKFMPLINQIPHTEIMVSFSDKEFEYHIKNRTFHAKIMDILEISKILNPLINEVTALLKGSVLRRLQSGKNKSKGAENV